MEKYLQITSRNNFEPVKIENGSNESLVAWLKMYFEVEVATSKSSQQVQLRDLNVFLEYFIEETGGERIVFWTPRLSRDFVGRLKTRTNESGRRRWSDRTVNRILAHLKTFAKWVHKHQPFALGNPAEKLRNLPTASRLAIERALTPRERRRLLDAADLLAIEGGRSKDRNRYKKAEERPKRKTYRPYRNRAIIYCLVETGMRRAAVTKIDLEGVDFEKRRISTEEKGGVQTTCSISREGMEAVKDYLDSEERESDSSKWKSSALFLTASEVPLGDGRLSPKSVNNIWNEVRSKARIGEDKTPHSARHAMGIRLLRKTNGNIAAVQLQLGHKNISTTVQYTRMSYSGINQALDEE